MDVPEEEKIEEVEPQEENLPENEDNRSTDQKKCLIEKIEESLEGRKLITSKNKYLQQKMTYLINSSTDKEYLENLNSPLETNEKIFSQIMRRIDEKTEEAKEIEKTTADHMQSQMEEMNQKENELKELNKTFSTLKEKVALHCIHSQTGEQYNKEQIHDLLRREADAQKIMEDFQLHSIKKRYALETAKEQKRNLVEGPVDYAEYEVMCTETENNVVIAKQIKEEIEDFYKKSLDSVNKLNHLTQKEHAAKIIKTDLESKIQVFQQELIKMRGELFKEKVKFGSMNVKNEDLHHKCILLQHPRLIEDYKNMLEDNKKAQAEIERLKSIYEKSMKIARQIDK